MDIDADLIKDLLACMEKARAVKAGAVSERVERILVRYLDGIAAGMEGDGTLVASRGTAAASGGGKAIVAAPGAIIRPPSTSKPAMASPPPAVPREKAVTAAPAPAPAPAPQPARVDAGGPGPAKEGPATTTMTVEDAVQSIVDRYNDEKVRPKFAGWENVLVISLPDAGKSFRFMVHGADGIEVTEAEDDAAAVQVTMDADMFIRLLAKQVNPIKAYSSGGLKVKGEMKNMLKLKKLMF